MPPGTGADVHPRRGPGPGAVHQGDAILLAFARAVRAAGVPVTTDRSQGFVEAAAIVGAGDPRATYWAGRATLCSGPDDLERYDQVWAAWFSAHEGLPRSRPVDDPSPPVSTLPEEEPTGDGQGDADEVVRAAASATEVLRHRDVATMGPAERAHLYALYARLHPRTPTRRAHRRSPWQRGELDPGRTLRSTLRRMGEPGELVWRRRGTRPRPVVLLVDVSGSMSGYADALLRLAHRIVTASAGGPGSAPRGRVEVFTLGTRLTRLTRAMRLRDPERALVAAGRTVPDWSGGTRLGETLQVFLDRWGQRGAARGAVVVVFSDGWERGDTTALSEQMARLHRLAHRVVWVNPHRGKTGYQPVQQGIVAALPYVDDFVAGHSLAAFTELLEVVAHA